MSTRARPHPPPVTNNSRINDGDLAELLNEERDEPPPYTPGPNPIVGETSLEFGPHRPFQPPPTIQPVRFLSPQSTGWTQTSSTSVSSTLAPPLHPSRQPTNDFYHSNTMRSPTTHPRLSPETFTRPQFVPPPGRPPVEGANGGSFQRSQSQRTPSESTPSDGRPTTTPTPGHPLLRNNSILVYPMGYQCHKCDNTGFKAYDPAQPCKKCWDKYAKPYRGAITYAPTTTQQNREGGTGNFQKPLPAFKPPHQLAPPSPGLRNSWSGYPGQGPPGPASPLMSRSTSMNFVDRPPAGALVVQPGDPRIGGRLCWRCNGSGVVSFLIFDQDTCQTCGGTGRTFN